MSLKGGILVHSCQKGNQLLKYIHNVPWEYVEDLSCDYQVGSNAGLLFLSLKFHQLKPDYIVQRIQQLKSMYSLRILLCLVDFKENEKLVFEVTNIAIQYNMTLILSWGWEEAAKCIENFKAFEHKSSTLLKAKIESDFYSRAEDFLKSTHAINKTDIMIIASKFKTLSGILEASQEELKGCQGIGGTKCVKLKKIFETNFKCDQ